MYVLDTDIIILFLKQNRAVIDLLSTIQNEDIAISVLSLGEIKDGLSRRSKEKEVEFAQFLHSVTVLPITAEIATKFGLLRHQLRHKNQLIGDIDTLISATCLIHQATLVTGNKKHYDRVPLLQLISPQST